MSDVVFVVDSGSDFEVENKLELQHPVEVVPLNIHLGDEVFLDGVDITKEEFYEKMVRSVELPKTSQPSPQQFYDVFKKYLDQGKQVVSLLISSSLSGTFQSALIAKDMLTEEEQQNVTLVDTNNISVVVLLLLKNADRMLADGKSIEEVVQWLNENKGKVKIFALLDTLENLKKGGRISSAQALIGGLLNIKPLITIEDGKVETLGKSRGRKKGLQQLAAIASQGNQYDHGMLFVAHSFKQLDDAIDEVKQIVDIDQFEHTYYYKLGSTIGTHAGVDTIAVALLEK